MVSMNQIESGIARYVDAEIAPKVPVYGQFGQAKKIAFLAGTTYVVRHLRGWAEKYLSTQFVQDIGLSDTNGNIDLPGVAEVLKQNIPETGIAMQLPIIGDVVFYKNDVDTLCRYIMGG